VKSLLKIQYYFYADIKLLTFSLHEINTCNIMYSAFCGRLMLTYMFLNVKEVADAPR